MIIFAFVFIFYLLHLHFYFFTEDLYTEIYYFNLVQKYNFSEDVASETALVSFIFLVAFVVSWSLVKKDSGYLKRQNNNINLEKLFVVEKLLITLLILYAIIFFIVSVKNDFLYALIAADRIRYSFLFESRMFLLIILSGYLRGLFLSKASIRKRPLALTAFAFYLFSLVAVQARSLLFEAVIVVILNWLLCNGDKIKAKYIIALFLSVLLPNIALIARFGGTLNEEELLAGIFGFEYLFLIPNFIGAELRSNIDINFLNGMMILVPSFLRNIFSSEVDYSYFISINEWSGEFGGGFSVVAHLIALFGVGGGVLIFCFLGALLSKLRMSYYNFDRLAFTRSLFPLVFIFFIISLRNDFYIFAKVLIQMVIVAIFLDCVLLRKTSLYFFKQQ